jgi:hypothetical protein
MADPTALDLDAQIHATVERLFRQFDGAVPKETVSFYVDEAARQWRDARVKVFVPVLAERFARQQLRALAAPKAS